MHNKLKIANIYDKLSFLNLVYGQKDTRKDKNHCDRNMQSTNLQTTTYKPT